MAAKANPRLRYIDLLAYDEQIALEPLLLDNATRINDAEEAQQGWFISTLSSAFDFNYTLPTLSTGFVQFLKSPYSHAYVERENTGGNFCGHHPNNPFFIMQHHPYFEFAEIDDLGDKRRPQILYDIVEKIKAYYYDPDVMPPLQIANADKRISDKKRRSEARERAVNLLCVMIMYMDLGSLRVGQPTKDGGFFSYAIEWLAHKAKLSLSRAKRAMSDLNDAMFISSYQYRELIDEDKKEYIAHNAVRVFDTDFFEMLEIDKKKFGKARKAAYQRQKDKEKTPSNKEKAVISLTMKKIMKSLDPNDKSLNTLNAAKNEEDNARTARLHKRRTALFLELSEDPYLRANEDAMEEVLQLRLEELNLLTDKEKAT